MNGVRKERKGELNERKKEIARWDRTDEQTDKQTDNLPCPALPCPALPCPALPCPALPCPALFISQLDFSNHLLLCFALIIFILFYFAALSQFRFYFTDAIFTQTNRQTNKQINGRIDKTFSIGSICVQRARKRT